MSRAGGKSGAVQCRFSQRFGGSPCPVLPVLSPACLRPKSSQPPDNNLCGLVPTFSTRPNSTQPTFAQHLVSPCDLNKNATASFFLPFDTHPVKVRLHKNILLPFSDQAVSKASPHLSVGRPTPKTKPGFVIQLCRPLTPAHRPPTSRHFQFIHHLDNFLTVTPVLFRLQQSSNPSPQWLIPPLSSSSLSAMVVLARYVQAPPSSSC